jgi:acyl-CoA synthetase (AMP-forming)/AMP-acid ligase II
LAIFERGWSNQWQGQLQKGYYIGRPHTPHTAVKVVKSIVADHPDHMVECDNGEPGWLVVKGDNLMGGYVKNDEATAKAMSADGWYLNLGDMCFWRTNSSSDGGKDYFWQSRDSALLIKGGSNYAYDARLPTEIRSRGCHWFPTSARLK